MIKYYRWKKEEHGRDTATTIDTDNITQKEARSIIADLIFRFDVDIGIDLETLLRQQNGDD